MSHTYNFEGIPPITGENALLQSLFECNAIIPAGAHWAKTDCDRLTAAFYHSVIGDHPSHVIIDKLMVAGAFKDLDTPGRMKFLFWRLLACLLSSHCHATFAASPVSPGGVSIGIVYGSEPSGELHPSGEGPSERAHVVTATVDLPPVPGSTSVLPPDRFMHLQPPNECYSILRKHQIGGFMSRARERALVHKAAPTNSSFFNAAGSSSASLSQRWNAAAMKKAASEFEVPDGSKIVIIWPEVFDRDILLRYPQFCKKTADSKSGVLTPCPWCKTNKFVKFTDVGGLGYKTSGDWLRAIGHKIPNTLPKRLQRLHEYFADKHDDHEIVR